LWPVQRTAAISFPGLPRAAVFLARQKGSLGLLRGGETSDLLLRQCPGDIYGSAIRKWPDLAAHVAKAEEYLAAQWPGMASESTAAGDDSERPARFADLVTVNALEPEREYELPRLAEEDFVGKTLGEVLGERNARTFAQAHWRGWRDGGDRTDIEFDERLAEDDETSAIISVADVVTADGQEARGDQAMAAAEFFAAEYAYRTCLEIRRRLMSRNKRLEEWSDDLTRMLQKEAYAKAVRSLVEGGQDTGPIAEAARGETALHCAALYGHDLVVRTLLEHGADANALTSDHRTPLHLAALKGHVEIARVLADNGADLDRRDDNELAAIDLARGKARQELLNLFARYRRH
jgi:hypothetical protein